MCKLFHCYIILWDYRSVICYGCCRCTLPQGHWWACMMTKDRQLAAWWQHQLWCWHQFDPTLSARFIWTCWRMAGSRTLYPAKLVSFSSGISVNRNACMNSKFMFSYDTCKQKNLVSEIFKLLPWIALERFFVGWMLFLSPNQQCEQHWRNMMTE